MKLKPVADGCTCGVVIDGYAKGIIVDNSSTLAINSVCDSKSLKFRKKCAQKPDWLKWATEACLRINDILYEIHKTKWNTRVLHIEHVKSYAPHVDHLVADVLCLPS